MSTSIAALRALIEQRFPDATPLTGGAQTAEQVATGIDALDRVLPNGGLPRGRLSVWAPQGGATAILRATCYSVVLQGERSAWIDGDNTVAGAFWNNAGGLYLVRPKSRIHALRAENHSVTFDVDTDALEPALQTLVKVGVRSLVSQPPSLEELFLRQYQRSER